ncbi:MAG: hypothetical protein ABI861_09280 [Panacibacter sp.]
MKIQLSGRGIGMPMLNNTVLLLFAFILTALFTSCKKVAVPLEIQIPQEQAITQQNAEAATSSTTNFGALISGNTKIDDEIKVLQKIGVNYVRYAIFLKTFSGQDKGYEKWVNAGFKVILNINYDQVSVTGKKVPVPFPTNMRSYRRLLEKVLDKYHPEVAVIENEPCTDAFHSGPIEDYITELKTAVDVCNQRNINVADGGIHVGYVDFVMNGTAKDGNPLETKKLIEAYKTIDLTYVNTHAKAPFDKFGNQNVYPYGQLEGYADFLRTQTGKPVMCNEYNQHNSSTTLMTGSVGGFTNGNYIYVIARSGSGSQDGASLNNGTSLTPLGIAYRDAINQ